jgi:hypothetical protein
MFLDENIKLKTKNKSKFISPDSVTDYLPEKELYIMLYGQAV